MIAGATAPIRDPRAQVVSCSRHRVDVPEIRRAWLFATPLALLAADFGIYLITMAELDWHLGTTNNRLILHVWPTVLFAYFLGSSGESVGNWRAQRWG